MAKTPEEKCDALALPRLACESHLPTPYIRLNKETFFSADISPEEQTLQITQHNPLAPEQKCTVYLFLYEFEEIEKAIKQIAKAR